MHAANIKCSAGALALLAAFTISGCKDKIAPVPKVDAAPATAANIDPRSRVIGVEPAGPSAETSATTSAAKSEISKVQQSNAMPLPGQANDHSTLSPKATQKPPTTNRSP